MKKTSKIRFGTGRWAVCQRVPAMSEKNGVGVSGLGHNIVTKGCYPG